MRVADFLHRDDKNVLPASVQQHSLLQRLLLVGETKQQPLQQPGLSLMEQLQSYRVKTGDLGRGTTKPQLKAKPALDRLKSHTAVALAASGGERAELKLKAKAALESKTAAGGESAELKRVSVHQEALGKFLKDLCESECEGGRLREDGNKENVAKTNGFVEGNSLEGVETGYKNDEVLKDGSCGLKNGGRDVFDLQKLDKNIEGIRKRFNVGGGRLSKESNTKECNDESLLLKVKLIPEHENGKIYSRAATTNVNNLRKCVAHKGDILMKKDKDCKVIADDEVTPLLGSATKVPKVDEGVHRQRKVSFKINKGQGCRRKPIESRVVLNSSVGNLTSRYNSNITTPEGLSSAQKSGIKVIVSRRNSTKRDTSASGVKKPEDVCIFNEKRSNISITYRPSILRSRPANVKAAIQMFEQNSLTRSASKAGNREGKDGHHSTEVEKGKDGKRTENVDGTEKLWRVEKRDATNPRVTQKVSMNREYNEEVVSKNTAKPLIFGNGKVEKNSLGIIKAPSIKGEKCEDYSPKSWKTPVIVEKKNAVEECKNPNTKSTTNVQRNTEEGSIKKSVTFQRNVDLSVVSDSSRHKTSMQDDKLKCSLIKEAPSCCAESFKSTENVNTLLKNSDGNLKPLCLGSDTESFDLLKEIDESVKNCSSSLSNNDVDEVTRVRNSRTRGDVLRPKYEAEGLSYESKSTEYAELISEGDKSGSVNKLNSIQESKGDSVCVTRAGSGVKYGGIKVLPNKSSLFSLLVDKDDEGKLRDDVACDVDGVSKEVPLCVTHSSTNTDYGSSESANGHLNNNLGQEPNKDKQLDEGDYEEVGIYKKPETTTVGKISGLAKRMMAFPKSTKSAKDSKSAIIEQNSDQKYVPHGVSKEIIKPNTSFLWGAVVAKPKAVDPPDIELTSDQEEEYDDVYPPEFYGYPDENIYDDIGNLIDEQQRPKDGSLRVPSSNNTPLGYEYVSSRNTYHERDNIYDDVKSLKCDQLCKDDTISVSNCYESIYDGEGSKVVTNYGSISDGDGSKGSMKYDSAGSTASTKSFCELNNSLYGGEGPGFHSSSVSHASTASVEELAEFEMHAASDCSANSDEWMDLEVSDSEMEAGTLNVVVHDRAKCGRSPSWAQRVRQQWSSRAPAPAQPSGESSESDTDHHYEMLYEVAAQANQDVPFDDFDSDNSDDLRPSQPPSVVGYNASLPQPPPAQYGISKMAEVAGNKLLKIRKSLSRMRQKRHTTEIRLTPPPSLPPPPLPPTPASPPLAPVPPLQKSTSARNLPNRKYWSLRKFRRSTSASIETSTFYLTDTVDVDKVDADSPAQDRQESYTAPATEASAEVGSDNGVSGSKSSLSSTASERRTSVRPHSPPPLPPIDPPKRPQRKEKRSDMTSTTSWYAECGLFDVNGGGGVTERRTRSNTWYADIGLWNRDQVAARQDVIPVSQMDDSLSSMSPSESSLLHVGDTSLSDSVEMRDSTDSVKADAERRFTDEPLYQFYTASVVELARRGMSEDADSDGYEEVPQDKVHYARPTAMELIPTHGQHRTLWCEIPEVINSRVMDALTTHQKKLQEAKFEIISSEASYIKSLSVLETHFMDSAEFNDESALSKSDRRILFGNVAPVKLVSQKFLADLEKCWQDNVLLSDICDVVYEHATHNFNPYVKYCSNQIYLDRTLRRLKDQHGRFAEVLTQLESSRSCQSLSLHSFLMLPMQRITRLPLLVDAMLTRMTKDDDEYHSCTLALARLNKVVKSCNEGARKMERMEEILILSHQLEFPKELKAIPIISSSRWLVRSGEVTQLVWRGDGEGKLTFGKKFSKTTLHVFLFTDLLIVTKKKSDESYSVLDYCPRNLVQLSAGDCLSHLPVKHLADGGKNLMLLTLLCNAEKKTVEMVLSCVLESDRQRWMQAMSQPTAANPEESVYEHWDCPQVAALHQFSAAQPDELALDVADVVNVLRKTPDGWYYGQRIRDGEMGWFPGNYATEIASAHVRAKNLKLRYRLLALSGNFLESQRKEKK